jgi:hypothetical protein
VRAAAAALLVALAGAAQAAPFAVQVGGERLLLDAPAGFSDTGFLASPRLQALAEMTTSASNRILLFAITDADLRRFMGGERPELRRYMLVVTPRGLEHAKVNDAQFREVVADALRELGTAAGTREFRRHLDAQPEGRAVLLAELKRQPDLVSILQGTRLTAPEGGLAGFFGGTRTQYVVATTTLLILKGKALQLSVYAGFDAPEDVDWVTAVTARWTEELLRLNAR